MNRTILKPFEDQQNQRTQFIQTIADLAQKNENIDALKSVGVLHMLKPLLSDNVPSIQQSAALALGRIASHSPELAQSIVDNEILPRLVYKLTEKNRFYKKAAVQVLMSVAKHSSKLARNIVESGALASLVECFEEQDTAVQEASCQAIAAIAKHEVELANAVFSAGAIPQIILCLQDSEVTLVRASIKALSEIAGHHEELAQVIVEGNAIKQLRDKLVKSSDAMVKQNACQALAQLAKHNEDLAAAVVDADILAHAQDRLRDVDSQVRKNAAVLLREVCKRNYDMARMVAEKGLPDLVSLIRDSKGTAALNALPAVMALGFISAWREDLATQVVEAGGVDALHKVLLDDEEHHLKGAAAWSLGQLAKHSEQLTQKLCVKNTLSKLMAVQLMDVDSPAMKSRVKQALVSTIEHTKDFHELVGIFLVSPNTDGNLILLLLIQIKKVFADANVGADAKMQFTKRESKSENGQERMIKLKDNLATIPESKDILANINEISELLPKNIKLIQDKDVINSVIDEIN